MIRRVKIRVQMARLRVNPRRRLTCLAPNEAKSISRPFAALSRRTQTFLLCRRWQSKRCYPPPMSGSTLRSDAQLHMRGFFTRKRDDSFSPASRGTEMSVSVCVGLWPNIIFSFRYLLEWEYSIKPASFNREGAFKRQSL